MSNNAALVVSGAIGLVVLTAAFVAWRIAVVLFHAAEEETSYVPHRLD